MLHIQYLLCLSVRLTLFQKDNHTTKHADNTLECPPMAYTHTTSCPKATSITSFFNQEDEVVTNIPVTH